MIQSFNIKDEQTEQLIQRINQLEQYIDYLTTRITTLEADYSSLAESFATFRDHLRNIC